MSYKNIILEKWYYVTGTGTFYTGRFWNNPSESKNLKGRVWIRNR
jgi:hypothetical protein